MTSTVGFRKGQAMHDAGQIYYVTLYDDKGLFVYFKATRHRFETFKGMERRIAKFSRKHYKDLLWRFSTHYERDLIAEGKVQCERMI